MQLRRQRGQVPQVHPRPRGGDQDRVRGRPHPAGSLPVQPQMARPNDSDISRPASAATTCGCAAARRAHAM